MADRFETRARQRKHHYDCKRNEAKVNAVSHAEERESWSTHNRGGELRDSCEQRSTPHSSKMADGFEIRQSKHRDPKRNGAEVKAIKETEERGSWRGGSNRNGRGSAVKDSEEEEESLRDGSNSEYGTEEEEEDVKEAAGNDGKRKVAGWL